MREPLLHFAVIGALIFAGVSFARSLQRPTVRIDAQELNQLVDYWRAQAQRPPTPPELKAILQERVDEELLAREAQRLGMDRGDLIIRRRLAQKMAFASEDAGASAEPGAAALRAYFAANASRYAAPGRAALRHIYFSADRGIEAARAAATQALGIARAGRGGVTGDPSLLPLTYADARVDDLARDYGPAFARAVAEGPVGEWRGPIQSPFGFHILSVQSRAPPSLPAFEAVQAQVREDYLAQARKGANEAFLRRLRRQYRVEVAGVTP